MAGGQNSSRDRQTVFFTVVNPMHKNHNDPQELDLTKPRLASYKQEWKMHQGTVYWVDIQLAQRKGLKFYQTRSNAIILYDTLPAYCISKAIVMKSEEIKNQKVYMCLLDHHRKFPTMKIGCAIWILILLEAARTPNELNQNPKPKYQVRRDPCVERRRKSRNVPSLIATLLIKRNMTMSQIQRQRGDPYVDTNPQNVACWHPNMLKMIKQVRGDPYWWIKEHKLDFRVPGLSHALVKEAEHLRVRELVKRIENHHHREALHAGLQ